MSNINGGVYPCPVLLQSLSNKVGDKVRIININMMIHFCIISIIHILILLQTLSVSIRRNQIINS